MALGLAPVMARAENPFDATEDFSNSETIADQELERNRGGFIDINGMLISFSFTGLATVNGQLVSQIQLDLANIINAANNNPGGFLQPTIIQNVDNNALIAVQQTLNLQVEGAPALINANAQFFNAAYESAIVFR